MKLTTSTLFFLFLASFNLKADTKIIYVNPFNILEMEGNFDVTLQQGESNKITIDAPKELVSNIKISESSTHLSITSTDDLAPYRRIHITILFTQLKEIESKIYGTLRTQKANNLESLFLDIETSQPTALELNVRKIDIDITGKGDIQLKGHSSKANINVSMQGNLDASNFIVDYLNIDSSSSGNVIVNAKIEASANNTGKGKLKFDGDAQTVDFCPTEFS